MRLLTRFSASPRGLWAALLGLTLTLASGCGLFGDTVYCDADTPCPEAQTCSASGICEASSDAGQTQAPDAGPIIANLGRGESCAGGVLEQCAAGLICMPFSSGARCEALCADECAVTDSNSCSDPPNLVCTGDEAPHCVDAATMDICRDVNADDVNARVCGHDRPTAHFVHINNLDLPQTTPEGCAPYSIELVGPKVCISAHVDSSVTELSGDLEILTHDRGGFTNPVTPCTSYLEFTMNSLRTLWGSLRIGRHGGSLVDSDVIAPIRAVTLPALTAVFEGVRVSEAHHLTQLAYPNLEYVGERMDIERADALTFIDFSGLKRVDGLVQFQNLPALTAIRVQSLEHTGPVTFSNVPCLDPSVVDAFRAVAPDLDGNGEPDVRAYGVGDKIGTAECP